METVAAFVGLGSNLGDPARNLVAALTAMEAKGDVITAKSSIYQTEPQGLADQPWFFNQVVRIDCPDSMSAFSMLDMLQDVEKALGRVRHQDPAMRFGPRIIDLDLLLFGDVTISTDRLILPHPRLHERAFAMVPLLEIAPDCTFPPPDGRRIADVLSTLDYVVNGTLIFQ